MSYYFQLYVSFFVLARVLVLMSALGSRTCPKGLNPAEAIAKIKLEMAAD